MNSAPQGPSPILIKSACPFSFQMVTAKDVQTDSFAEKRRIGAAGNHWINTAWKNLRWLWLPMIAAVAFILDPQSSFGQSGSELAAPIVIKVGVSEYQNVETIYQGYIRLFHDLALLAPKDQPVSFQVAVGSYQEVLDWWERKEIDAAVLAATPTAMLLKSIHDKIRRPQTGKDATARLARVREQLRNFEDSYVATVGWPLDLTKPPLQKQLTVEQRAQFHRVKYGVQLAFHTVAVIANRDDLKSVRTFQDLMTLGRPIKLLYVRPYSSSGYILPKYFLKSLPQQWRDNSQVTFSFVSQQPRALDRLLRNPPEAEDQGKVLVAFVHDGSVPQGGSPSTALRVLEGTELFDQNPIPHNVLLVNYNLAESFSRNKDLLSALVKNSTNLKRPLSLKTESHWIDNYKALETWLGEPGIELPKDLEYSATIDEIVDDLVGYEQSTHITPRLALVLSGGGAKCAYQAGALEAIEAKFEDRRRECATSTDPKCKILSKLDINLVVGTSGGSINALFAAMKTTKDPAGQSADKQGRLSKMWTSLQLASLINPSDRLLFWISAWFGLVQSFFVSIFAIIYTNTQWRWSRLFLGLPLLLLAEEVIIGIIQIRLTSQVYLIFSAVAIVAVAWAIGMFQKKPNLNQGAPARRVRTSLIVILATAVVLLFMLGLAIWQGAFARYTSTILLLVFVVQTLACLAVFGIMSFLKSAIKIGSWWDLAAWTVLIMSILEFIFSICWGLYANLPAQYHWFEHLLLLLRLPFRLAITIPVPIAVGLLMIALPWGLKHLQIPWQCDKNHLTVVGTLAVMMVVFATITLAILLERETSPTDSEALATSMANVLPKYYSDIVTAERTGSTVDQLRRYSRQIVEGGKVGRDLVITASRLHSSAENESTSELPDDLYFYYQAGKIAPANQRNQFISFEDHNEDKLLETVIGSSTIYPVFPPQRLQIDIYDKDEQIKLTDIDIVDGGFIHNSPIDAALKWQATHIILIDASPAPDEQLTDNFQGNIANAFNYLFDQAQNRDQLSRGMAELYVLRPTCNSLHTERRCTEESQWSMDLFDFSQAPLKRAIAQGWIDVYAEAAPELPVNIPGISSQKRQITTVPLFVRQAATPVFRDVADYKPTP